MTTTIQQQPWFPYFSHLADDLKVLVAEYLDTHEGINLMRTSRENHALVATRGWRQWRPILRRGRHKCHWDGPNNPETYTADVRRQRHILADAARNYQWPAVLQMLTREEVNTTRPGGTAGYTPLHQAAHGNAPLSVVRHLVYGLGAWRTLRTEDGSRAVDIARQLHPSNTALIAVLEPPASPHAALLEGALQDGLHAVMRRRAARSLDRSQYRMPQLAVLTEVPEMFCPIPGMYGGFSVQFVDTSGVPTIVAESWCRVAEGSGQRHEITAMETKLVADGF